MTSNRDSQMNPQLACIYAVCRLSCKTDALVAGPLRVISGHGSGTARTSTVVGTWASFDDLVGAAEQRKRYRKVKRFGRFHIDN